MGVTHIIRGDDHLTNAGRQKILYDALGWPVPVMSHIPLIHGPDGAKLSKRHGALGVDAYRAMGYLPEAMRNYLVRLGWAHGDDEIISEADMIAWFDLPAINRAPSRFDFAKLGSINAHYMRAMSDGDLTTYLIATLPHLPEGDAFAAKLTDARKAQLRAAMPLLKDRAKTLLDLISAANFIVHTRPLAIDAAAAALLTPDARELLKRVIRVLSSVGEWTAAATEAAVKDFAARE